MWNCFPTWRIFGIDTEPPLLFHFSIMLAKNFFVRVKFLQSLKTRVTPFGSCRCDLYRRPLLRRGTDAESLSYRFWWVLTEKCQIEERRFPRNAPFFSFFLSLHVVSQSWWQWWHASAIRLHPLPQLSPFFTRWRTVTAESNQGYQTAYICTLS